MGSLPTPLTSVDSRTLTYLGKRCGVCLVVFVDRTRGSWGRRVIEGKEGEDSRFR